MTAKNDSDVLDNIRESEGKAEEIINAALIEKEKMIDSAKKKAIDIAIKSEDDDKILREAKLGELMKKNVEEKKVLIEKNKKEISDLRRKAASKMDAAADFLYKKFSEEITHA